jgi:hypothetical protein
VPRPVSFADLLKAGQCWWLLLGTDLVLRLLPFTTARRLLDRPPVPRPTGASDADAEVRRLDRLVRAAARRHLYPMTCLRRSLVLKWLLSGAGIPAELRMGVRPEQGSLEAHAWVEYQGEPVGEDDGVAVRYTTLDLPEPRR